VSSHSTAHAPSIPNVHRHPGHATTGHCAAGASTIATQGSGDFQPVAEADRGAIDWAVEAEFVNGIRGGPAPTRNDFGIGLEYLTFTDAVVESAGTGGRRLILQRGEP